MVYRRKVLEIQFNDSTLLQTLRNSYKMWIYTETCFLYKMLFIAFIAHFTEKKIYCVNTCRITCVLTRPDQKKFRYVIVYGQ